MIRELEAEGQPKTHRAIALLQTYEYPERVPSPPPESHLPPALSLTLDEQGNYCFGCGPDNPQGLHLLFEIHAEDPAQITVTAPVNLTRMQEGPPGYLHGGIIATLMDEAMSKLNRPLNVLAMTRHMEVDYLRPAPLHQPLTLTGRHLRREGRKLFHTAELTHSNGTILAEAKGVFLVIDPALVKAHQDTTRNPA